MYQQGHWSVLSVDNIKWNTIILSQINQSQTARLHKRFHVNVQKSISHHKYKCNVAVMKTGLTRMYVVKIQYFHEYPDVLPKPVTH